MCSVLLLVTWVVEITLIWEERAILVSVRNSSPIKQRITVFVMKQNATRDKIYASLHSSLYLNIKSLERSHSNCTDKIWEENPDEGLHKISYRNSYERGKCFAPDGARVVLVCVVYRVTIVASNHYNKIRLIFITRIVLYRSSIALWGKQGLCKQIRRERESQREFLWLSGSLWCCIQLSGWIPLSGSLSLVPFVSLCFWLSAACIFVTII